MFEFSLGRTLLFRRAVSLELRGGSGGGGVGGVGGGVSRLLGLC